MRKKPGEELVIRPNKSQLKRESDALQNLGEQLTRATASDIKKCDLPDHLLAAIAEYQRLPNKHGAQRRQMQFIGKVMRDLDETTIERIHAQLNRNVEMEKRRFQRIEALRDSLINSDGDVVTSVLNAHPQLDAQTVNQLVRQARKEQEEDFAPTASRKLFRYLRETLDV